MWNSAVEGFLLAVQWPAVGYLGLGILLGTYFGAVPGLSGLTGMAILLPFTFGMDSVSAFSFLLGMYAVTTTSDTIPAVLIGVPGTAAGQATVLDGFPLSKKGEASRAFGAAFTSSAIGGVMGAVLMGLSIPLIQPVVLSFAMPEFLMLGVLAMTMVGSLSGSSIPKGLLAACAGLMLSMIGYADQVAIPRYWMDMPVLLDGVPLVVMVLGVFAIPEAAQLAAIRGSVSNVQSNDVSSGFFTGMRDVFKHRWLMVRCAFLGVYTGLLPGIGSSIADWVAYGHAVQSAKDKSQFGKGDIRGVIAPETANNSVKGGELVPTVAFGIPGSAPMAVLLGAFLIQGLVPGPTMLTTQLPLTYSMMWTLVFANITAAIVLSFWTKQLQRIIFLPGRVIVPAISMFVLMGAWNSGAQISLWYLLIAFGLLGTLFKVAGWPRAPMVLGFILGPIMENSLYISMNAYGFEWLTRPIVIVLAVGIILVCGNSIRRAIRRKHDVPIRYQESDGDIRASTTLSLAAIAVFGCAIVFALPWPNSVKLFPIAIGIPALVVALFTAGRDLRTLKGGFPQFSFASTLPGGNWAGLTGYFVWLVLTVVATMLFSQLIALPVMIMIFLIFITKLRWYHALAYALVCGVFLYVVFDRVVGTLWQTGTVYTLPF